MANPHALGGAHPAGAAQRIALIGARRRAGRVVLRGIGQDFEFAEQLHVLIMFARFANIQALPVRRVLNI